MIFQSIDFLLFFSSLLCLYFWLPARGQNLLLLIAGAVFYGWIHPWFLLLNGGIAIIDWACARGMEGTPSPARRKTFLTISLTANLLSLGVFKYLGFFTENVTAVLTALHLMPEPMVLKLMLPVGLSFFTFQNISYALDVYRGQQPACRSLIEYLTFATYFPQRLAGPIERASRMLPQYRVTRRPALMVVRSGIVLALWGLFQKMVIADSASILANKVFMIRDASFPVLWGGVIAYGVQIYADFSGYTALARGCSRILGIELCPNFNHPYIAQSPGDFWRRWHMSLSRWFKDYVYIPLGGSRDGPWMTRRNLMVVFLVSGLWHGAGWNFILWGAFHGLLICTWPHLSRAVPLFGEAGGRAGIVFRVVFTFAIMHVGRLFFREHDLAMIWQHLTLNPLAATVAEWRVGAGMAVEAVLYGLPLTLLYPLLDHKKLLLTPDDPRLQSWRWTAYQTLLAALLLFGVCALRSPETGDFIYFQF